MTGGLRFEACGLRSTMSFTNIRGMSGRGQRQGEIEFRRKAKLLCGTGLEFAKSNSSQPGAVFSPGDTWGCLGTFLVVTTQSGASRLASGGQGPGRPLQGAH